MSSTSQNKETNTPKPGSGKGVQRTGLVLSWLLGLFMLFIAGMNIIQPESVVQQTRESGFPVSAMLPLGIVLACSTLLYLYPKTMVLGCVLLTGYFGGAVATHVVKGDGLGLSLFPVLFGILTWLGGIMQCKRLRAILPLRT